MLRSIKTSNIIIINSTSTITATLTKTTHMDLQIDAEENIEGQNNSVTQERISSSLIIIGSLLINLYLV